ncbi:MAG: formate dehydrogenase subunit gamma [Gemmatimonadetes bacterium]|nr:formate dehydrogenase subunit gamma [Gemmatimonadota bacterium]
MPPETATAPWTPAVQRALDDHKARPGALLPILHEIQQRVGHVPPEAVPVIAEALNLSRAEVHGVVTFYHDFRDHPAGRHVLKVCLAESCQAVGCDHLLAHAKQRLGVELHGTSADGAVTLEPVYCLGNCALSPALMVDGDVVGRATPEKLDGLLAELRRPA